MLLDARYIADPRNGPMGASGGGDILALWVVGATLWTWREWLTRDLGPKWLDRAYIGAAGFCFALPLGRFFDLHGPLPDIATPLGLAGALAGLVLESTRREPSAGRQAMRAALAVYLAGTACAYLPPSGVPFVSSALPATGEFSLLTFALLAGVALSLEARAKARAGEPASSGRDLADRQALIQQIFDTSSVAIFLTDRTGRIVQANRRMAEMFGTPLPRLLGSDYLDLVAPGLRDAAARHKSALLAGEIDGIDADCRYRRADGSEFWGYLTGKRFEPGQDGSGQCIGAIADIDRRKNLDDFEKFRSRILEMLAGGESLEAILHAIASGLEGLRPDALCSVLLLDAEGKRLKHGAAPSLPDFYNAAVDGLVIGQGVGSCGTAAFSGERIVVQDIAAHPYWRSFRQLAARAGVKACWSQPVFSATRQVLGAFAVYHRRTHAPTPQDIELVEQSARLASIAIEKHRAEERLRESQTFVQGVLDSVVSEIAVLDQEGVILAVNEAWRRFALENGAEPDMPPPNTDVGVNYLDVCGTDAQDTPEEAVKAREGIRGVLDGRLPKFSLEYPCNSPQEARWFIMTVSPLTSGGKTGAVVTHSDITDRKRIEEQVRALAYSDALTQLPNRLMLDDRLSQTMADCRRKGTHGAAMLLDLDRFKPLNDEYGHAAGDALLIEVARRLRASVREIDTVARLGGDEFVAVLGGLDAHGGRAAAQALHVAEKIGAALNLPYALPLGWDGRIDDPIEHRCSSSIGVALFDGHENDANEILKRADVAMYRAKQAGRGSVCLFER